MQGKYVGNIIIPLQELALTLAIIMLKGEIQAIQIIPLDGNQ